MSVSFSLSLSVRVERGCAVRVLLQCRQTPDSPIRYYSLCVCLQGSVSSTGEAVLLYTHAQTHTANSSTPSLSAGKHSHCPASTSAHPPPSWLNAYYLPLSPPLHFPYWHPSFSFYLYSSSSSFSSHSASFPLLCFSLIILILVGPVKRVRQKIQNVCFQTPPHTYSITLFKSMRALSSLILWCRSRISLDLTSKVMTFSIKGWR